MLRMEAGSSVSAIHSSQDKGDGPVEDIYAAGTAEAAIPANTSAVA